MIKNRTLVVLIGIYMVLANVGVTLSKIFSITYIGEVLLLTLYSVILLTYIKKQDLGSFLGLRGIQVKNAKMNLFFLPLILIILANGVFFPDTTMKGHQVFLTVVMMFLVAFCEEILFRGFLLQGLQVRYNTWMAIIVSGTTFGIGHIVNLLNGYTGIHQVLLAVLLGILMSALTVRTKSIYPAIVFHFLFNSASALSCTVDPLIDYICMGIIILVSCMYMMFFLLTGKALYQKAA